MKMFFTGTDSLMLIDVSRRKFTKKLYWIAFRCLVKIMDFFTDEYYCDSEQVYQNLIKFGIKKKVTVFKDKLIHTKKYKKIKHNTFNIIFYKLNSYGDEKFSNWLYGYDIAITIAESLNANICLNDSNNYKKITGTDINLIILNGDADMKDIYPVSDFYLRPNRHDGASRMRQECEIQGIPYYWSYKNPDITKALKMIKNEYKRKSKLQQKKN